MGLNLKKLKAKIDEIKTVAAVGAVLIGSKYGQQVLERLDPASRLAENTLNGIEAAKELIKRRPR